VAIVYLHCQKYSGRRIVDRNVAPEIAQYPSPTSMGQWRLFFSSTCYTVSLCQRPDKK